MKRGDLVVQTSKQCIFNDDWFQDTYLRLGIIITWVRYGGPEGTVWEVLYSDGTEYWDENDLEVISEIRPG